MIRHHPPLHRVIIGRIVQALLIIIAGYIIGVAIFSSKVFGALQQNVASQKLYIYDYDTTNNTPKTGDAANITVYRSLDGGTATAISGNPTELSSTNAPGVYVVSPSQADTNGNYIAFTAISTTSGCKIDPLFVSTDNATIGSRGTSTLAAGAQMDLVNAPNATAITAIQLGLSKPGTAQTITFPTNPSVNVAQWGASNVTGMPMPTYVQPTGFLAALFPGTIASPTNITAGTITTVTTTTNLTNLPSIPANWITAAGITAGALNGKGDWLLSSGYTAPPSAATITSSVAAQITTDHGTGSYIRNTEPDNADIGNIAKGGSVVGSDWVWSTPSLANSPSGGGGFTGSKSCTLTFNDANGNPVGNVGFAVSGTGATATAGGGSIAVGLNPGTYTVTPSPQSGTMWTPTSITVTSASTQTFSFNGTSIVIPPASDPGACNVSLKFLNPDLSPAAGRPITLIMTQAPPGNGTGYITTGTPLKVTTGSDGTVLVPLPRLSHYSISAPPSLTTPLIVPDQPAYSPNNIRL